MTQSGYSNVMQVASTTSTATLAAANTARLGLYVYNDSAAILYILFGTGATNDNYTVQVAAGGFYEMPADMIYTGAVTGTWASADGVARVTELS